MLKYMASIALVVLLGFIVIIVTSFTAHSGDKVVKDRGGKVVETWNETRDGDYAVKDRGGRVTGTIKSDRGDYKFVDRGGKTSEYTDGD